MGIEPTPCALCVIANVTGEPHTEVKASLPGGIRVVEPDRTGTRHFAPGAKLYVMPACWPDGTVNVRLLDRYPNVIGKHRGSPGLVQMHVNARWLVRWRIQVVYNPLVVRRILQCGGWTREAAELSLAHWAAYAEFADPS